MQAIAHVVWDDVASSRVVIESALPSVEVLPETTLEWMRSPNGDSGGALPAELERRRCAWLAGAPLTRRDRAPATRSHDELRMEHHLLVDVLLVRFLSVSSSSAAIRPRSWRGCRTELSGTRCGTGELNVVVADDREVVRHLAPTPGHLLQGRTATRSFAERTRRMGTAIWADRRAARPLVAPSAMFRPRSPAR